METLQEEKDVLVRNPSEIVPVHLVTRKDLAAAMRSHSENQTAMKIQPEDVGRTSEESDHIDLSQWLWGGSFGDKKSLLLFRSCVLAPKRTNLASNAEDNPESLKTEDDLNFTGSNEILSENNGHNTTSDPFGSPVKEWQSTSFHQASSSNGTKWKSRIRSKLQLPNADFTSHNFDESSLTQSLYDSKKESAAAPKNKFIITSKSSSLPSAINRLSFDQDCGSLDSVYSYSSVLGNNDNVVVPLRNQMPASKLNVTFKTSMAETKLLSKMLHAHGFTDADPQSANFNLIWSGLHPKPDILRSLMSYQRVNHFPRSYELTRKDKLFKNIEKLQYILGFKNFDFIPLTFLMPLEYKDLCTTHYRIKGPWIVKPAASSRGRGIYIVNTPDQIPKAESVVVAKYIDKPLLVNGHKCDLRLYVCVTSFDPLLIYMYEDGLARFATVKYDKSNKSLWNPCMHLCNYSINKYHSDYVKSEDPLVENVGHKWTLSAFLRHLKKDGHDTATLMTAIEDVVVKSIFSCTQTISIASRMFVPYFTNCFELFGFDILIDENLKPWLLEINLSPSLGCDTPLDVRLKSALLVDTLNLVGIPAVDPTPKSKQCNDDKKSADSKMRMKAYRRVHSAENMTPRRRTANSQLENSHSLKSSLSNEEIRMIKYVRAQYERRGGYVRIFPSQDSWRRYSQYLDPVTGIPISNAASKSSTFNPYYGRNLNLLIHAHVLPDFDQTLVSHSIHLKLPDRLKRYERVLPACNKVSLDSASSQGSEGRRSDVTSAKASPQESKNTKSHIKQHIQHSTNLSQEESRRAFAVFLTCVLRRISKSTSEQSVQHAEWILRFLKKISHSLKLPYTIKAPSQKMNDKDKTAVIAKQLNDFLHVYYKDIDIHIDSSERKRTINSIRFNKFLINASEADLEDILLAVLKKDNNAIPFLGDKQSPMCFDIPPSTSLQFFNKDAPIRHQLLKYLVYITPIHSRRFKPFGIDRTVLPPIVSEDK